MKERTGHMENSKWLAINTTLPRVAFEQLFKSRNLSQKQVSDFWEAHQQVRDCLI